MQPRQHVESSHGPTVAGRNEHHAGSLCTTALSTQSFLTLNHLQQITYCLWSATSPYATSSQVAFLPALVLDNIMLG